MKIRILGNNVRLRLSQTEMNDLETHRKISSDTDFGTSKLTYGLLISSSAQDMTAEYANHEIKVTMPTDWAAKWFGPDEVGVENKDQSQIKILVEKDFQCLHKRPGEDESDNFPNPVARETH